MNRTKDELKDELKNRISMALKDPVLQQGFEIICKENTELEKHNEELIVLINAERERQEKCDDVHLRKIADLEQENLDLKAQIEKMRNFENCDYQLHVTDCPIFKSGGHISCKKCPHWILQEVSERQIKNL